MTSSHSDSPEPRRGPLGRLSAAVLLTLGGGAAYMPYAAHASIPPEQRLPVWGAIAVVLLVVAAIVRRRAGAASGAWIAAWAVFAAGAANLASWWPTEWVRAGLDPDARSTQGLATLTSMAVVVLTILVLAGVAGRSPGSLYLRRGRPGWWLPVGLAGMALFALTAIPAAGDMFGGRSLSVGRVVNWAPSILLFVLANGVREEIMFRGLLLSSFSGVLGTRASVLVTSLVFALAHVGVTYTPQVPVFLVVTFLLGVVFAAVTLKGGSLWGAALLHAGADIPVIVGIFSGL